MTEVGAPPGEAHILFGAGMGDEGKLKIAAHMILTTLREVPPDRLIVARYNGGNNAGGTDWIDGREIKHNLLPAGVTHEGVRSVIGNGTLVNPEALLDEIDRFERWGFSVTPDNLEISNTATLILPSNIEDDVLHETGEKKEGTTKKGIGPASATKYGRRDRVTPELVVEDPDRARQIALDALLQVRDRYRFHPDVPTSDPEAVVDQWLAAAQRLAPFYRDTIESVNEHLEGGGWLLAQGAQAVGLDIEHGVEGSSSHTTPGGALNGLGISQEYVTRAVAGYKILPTRVGGTDASFRTRIQDEQLEDKARGVRGEKGAQYGVVTGRPRNMGWPDLAHLRNAARLGATELALTMFDSVPQIGRTLLICVGYSYRGRTLKAAPNSVIRMGECEPIYRDFPTWQEDIGDIRDYKDLPSEAKKVVEFIEEETGKPVTMIGVGADRDQVITKAAA